MQVHKALKKLGVALAAVFTAGALSGCAKREGVEATVQESGYSIPFPLQNGGEQIDILVRVRDVERAYQFNLILVEPRHWPEKKKDQLWRLYQGHLIGDTEPTAYPVKLRIRIDSVRTSRGRPVRIDHEISERSPVYGQSVDDAIWRALSVHAGKFQPGVYRVRVDNLAPTPQFDFETRFLFERDNRKY